jgi:alpha-N-arabinofuranosidase
MAELGGALTGTAIIDRARGTRSYSRLIFAMTLPPVHAELKVGILVPRLPLLDRNGYRRDVIEALRELGPSIVQWPGPVAAGGYHWRDGVGASRATSVNLATGKPDINAFGTDEFVAWCREIGAEPALAVNAATGTLQEAAEWVEYCNGTLPTRNARARHLNGSADPHAVRHWTIASSDWPASPQGRDWALHAARFAAVLRRSDPTAVITASADNPSVEALLAAAGDSLDAVGLDGALLGLGESAARKGYRAAIPLDAGKPEAAIAAMERQLAGSGRGERVGIVVDGWGRSAGSGPVTMADAIHAASLLNACLRHGESVRQAFMAPDAGPVIIHEKGVLRLPPYHVLAIYAGRLLPRLADCFMQSDRTGGTVAALDGAVSCEGRSGPLSLMLVNRDAEREMRLSLRIDGEAPDGPFEAMILAGDSPDAFNDIDHPERVRPLKTRLIFRDGVAQLPPHALLSLRIERPSLGEVRTPAEIAVVPPADDGPQEPMVEFDKPAAPPPASSPSLRFIPSQRSLDLAPRPKRTPHRTKPKRSPS